MTRKDPERDVRSADAEQSAGEDFLQRWSRRKARAREDREDVQQPPASPPADPVDTNGQSDQEKPPLTDADMPQIDSLTAESDISGFFSPGVSEKLRSIALRKVFSLPFYNLRDGLDDYDEDYTVFEPLGDTVTSDMRHRQEREAERREREARERQQADAEAAPTESESGEPDEAVAGEAEDESATAARSASADDTDTEASTEDSRGPDEDRHDA